MKYSGLMTSWARHPRRLYLLGALCLCALLLLFTLAHGWRTPVIETITTEGGARASQLPAQAVQFTPQLPQRDADVEAAGDQLAAATAYLKNRQSAAALRAMTQARAAVSRAIDRRRQQGKRIDVLEEALKEIVSAERFVQRGALNDARARLISLNRKLDDTLER